MDCEKALWLMEQEANEEASPEELRALHAHVNSCEACRKLYEIYQNLDAAVADLAEEPPEHLAEGILYRIGAGGKKRKRFIPFAGTIAAAAAAVLLLVVGGKILPAREQSKDAASVERSGEQKLGFYETPSNEAASGKTAEGDPVYDYYGFGADAPQAGESDCSGAAPSECAVPSEYELPSESALELTPVAYLQTDRTPEILANTTPVQTDTQVEDPGVWLYRNSYTVTMEASNSDLGQEAHTVAVYLIDMETFSIVQDTYGDACVMVQGDAAGAGMLTLVVAETEDK